MHGSQPPAPPRFSLTEKAVVVINKPAVKKLNLKNKRYATLSYDRSTRIVTILLHEKKIPLSHEFKIQSSGQATLGIKKLLQSVRAFLPTQTKRHDLKQDGVLTFKIE